MHTRAFPAERRTLRRLAVLAALSVAAVVAPTSEADGAIRSTANYKLGNDQRPARGKDAVGFAVNPRNPRHIVGVWADWVTGECEFGVSRNAGRTWRSGELQAPEGFSDAPCTVGPHLAEHMDAGVAWGGRNRVYATFASARQLADGSEEGKSVLVARSNNGGRSFRTATVAAPGGPNGDDGPNHILPKIGVEPGARRDRVYAVAGSTQVDHAGGPDQENSVVSISADSGNTWLSPRNANAAGDNAIEQSAPVIARDGTVYVAWRSRGRGSAPGQFTPEGFVTVAKSTDRGQTWSQVRSARVTGYTYTGPPAPPFTTQRAYTASTFPELAIDRRRHRLYLVYGDGGTPTVAQKGQVRGADHFINPDEDVWFQRSTDRNGTWSSPRRLNDGSPTEITQTRHPNVSVARNGRVDVVWNDRRHWYRGCVHTHSACQETRIGDTYYAYSPDGGSNFSRNRRISDRSSGLDVGFDYRFGTGWAYGPFAAPLGNKRLLIGWMDSRRGNVENDAQDIYLARLNLRARGRVPQRRIRTRTSLADFSARMSRLAYPGGGEAVLASTFATRPWARVVIVNEEDTAAALAGSVLARANVATVLVAPAGGLPDRVEAEVARLAPIGAYVLGDESRLGPGVVADLVAAGVPQDEVVRISGGDDAATAAQVAGAMDRRSDQERSSNTPAFDAAVIANPASPDAATAAAWAANRRLPVLYTGRDEVPRSTRDALASLAIDRTFVIGSTEWIGNGVAQSLPAATRVGGTSALGTSRAVVRQSRRWGLPGNLLYVSESSDSMATAIAGAAVARTGGLLAVAPGPRGARRVARRLGLNRVLDRIVTLQAPPRSAVR